MTTEYDADHLSRTALLFGRRAGDAEAGAQRHQSSRVLILAGIVTCSTRTGHGALLTAVKTAVRAFGEVVVVLADESHPVLGGPLMGTPLGEAVLSEGALLATTVPGNPPGTVVIVGDCPGHVHAESDWLAATWTSWRAVVAPVDQLSADESAPDGNILASIAAGALAVAEAFFTIMDEPGDRAGRRRVEFDLWLPESSGGMCPPDLRHAPAYWWLLGLGHLGQGYAHAISWLDYSEPAEVQVVLQDTQRTVAANHSTGILTSSGSEGERKTRIAADALDRCGINTVVVERRMGLPTPVRSEDMHVGLVGVDNLPTRRDIDAFGWQTAIDVGLGAGVSDFDGLTIIRFPGRPSVEVPAWQEPTASARSMQETAFTAPGLDACGITELQGVAVGASFVGAIAGVVAVAEALRPLHGGDAYSVQCYGLRENEFDGAPAKRVDPPVAVSLRPLR